jgi:serine protease Do
MVLNMIKFFGHCTVTGLIGGVLLGAMLSASIAASTTIDTRVPIVDLPDFTQLVEEKLSGVVQLQVSSKVAEASVVADEEISDDDGNPIAVPAPKVDSGSGSGFIISDDGYVVTNAHVVEGKDGLGEVDIIITLSDRREFKGELIGFDQPSDVALVKIIDGTNLPVVTLGDSSKVSPGQWAIAIGQPFGFENTITAGILSSINRYLPSDAYIEFIQTVVAINPGNSGGPLFDVYGDVI